MMTRGRHQVERRMRDTLQTGVRSGSGSGPSPVSGEYVYDDQNPVQCTVLENQQPREVEDGSEATITNVVILVPEDNTSVTGKKRVKVTHRDRAALGTAEEYSVHGAPQKRRSHLALNCKRIVGKSVK